MNKKIVLSVVIIGRNEGERLIKCIKSVKEMNYDNEKYEIIYVDSQSKDESIVNAYNLGVDEVLRVNYPNLCAAKGRNQGLKYAKGDYILFLDGDTIIDADFINKALPIFSIDPKIAIVFGHRVESKKDSLYIKICDLDWDRSEGYSQTSAGDILIKKDVLIDVGGYLEIIAGEDPELSNRIINAGYMIYHIDFTMVLHDISMYRFSQYWKHAVRSGYAYGLVSRITSERSFPLWQNECRKNYFHCFLLFSLFFTEFLGIVMSSFVTFMIPLVIFSMLLLKTILKNHKRINDPKITLMYALHSHLVKIPIVIGQLKSLIFRERSKLIEYK